MNWNMKAVTDHLQRGLNKSQVDRNAAGLCESFSLLQIYGREALTTEEAASWWYSSLSWMCPAGSLHVVNLESLCFSFFLPSRTVWAAAVCRILSWLFGPLFKTAVWKWTRPNGNVIFFCWGYGPFLCSYHRPRCTRNLRKLQQWPSSVWGTTARFDDTTGP